MEAGSRKRGRVKMGGMKGAEEGSGGGERRSEPRAEAESLRHRDAFARVGKYRVAWMCCRNER